MAESHRIKDHYVHLAADGSAGTLEVTADFWPRLAAGALPQLDEGRLLSQSISESDWSVWEMHPQGEEIVLLLGGRADLLLDLPGGVRVLPLSGVGSYVLVPRGVWHTANVHEPASLLFITPGYGTQHRPR